LLGDTADVTVDPIGSNRNRYATHSRILRGRGYVPVPTAPEVTFRPYVAWRSYVDEGEVPAEMLDTWEQSYPDANIAIQTRLSGVLVVDVDTKAEAKPGLVSLDRLVQEGLVASPCRISTPSGGHHLYYGTTRSFAKDILGGPGDRYPGVDLKVWGLVAAPPSVRPNGIAYCGELPPVSDLPQSPFLENLIEELTAESEAKKTAPRSFERSYQKTPVMNQRRPTRVEVEEFITLMSRLGVDLLPEVSLYRCGNVDHEDVHPSMVVAETDCVYHCRSCGFEGGLMNLRVYVGEHLLEENAAQSATLGTESGIGAPTRALSLDAPGKTRLTTPSHSADKLLVREPVYRTMPPEPRPCRGATMFGIPKGGAPRTWVSCKEEDCSEHGAWNVGRTVKGWVKPFECKPVFCIMLPARWGLWATWTRRVARARKGSLTKKGTAERWLLIPGRKNDLLVTTYGVSEKQPHWWTDVLVGDDVEILATLLTQALWWWMEDGRKTTRHRTRNWAEVPSSEEWLFAGVVRDPDRAQEVLGQRSRDGLAVPEVGSIEFTKLMLNCTISVPEHDVEGLRQHGRESRAKSPYIVAHPDLAGIVQAMSSVEAIDGPSVPVLPAQTTPLPGRISQGDEVP